jgi:FkbM family methyltransferase
VTFPTDEQWAQVAALIRDGWRDGDRVLAPVEFEQRLSNVASYRLSRLSPPTDYQWVVLHKGLLEHVDRAFLQDVQTDLLPVLANDVFVVYASRPGPVAVSPDDPHLQSLSGFLAQLDENGTRAAQPPGSPRFESARELALVTREVLETVSRAAAQSTYLGARTALCRVLARYLFYVDTADVAVAPHLLLDGCWEPWITRAVAGAVRDGDHCLDVGANHGYFAALLADAAGPRGRVRACEPQPRLASLVRQTLEVNGLDRRVEVVERAVTDHGGDHAVLRHPAGRLGSASLYRECGESTATETVTIDELVADWPRVDVVKVDVEGAEDAVWRGMRETLRANPGVTVIMEFSAFRGYDPREFLARIEADGFPLRYVDMAGAVEDLPADRCLSESQEWMLFLRRT